MTSRGLLSGLLLDDSLSDLKKESLDTRTPSPFVRPQCKMFVNSSPSSVCTSSFLPTTRLVVLLLVLDALSLNPLNLFFTFF